MSALLLERPVTRLAGQAAKRGLIPRLPTADRLLADALAFVTTDYGDLVRSSRMQTGPDGSPELALDLYPAMPPLVLRAADTGRVTADAETLAAGPGYRRFVGRLVERLGLELEVDWTARPPEGDEASAADAPPAEDAATFASRPAAERDYLAWLGNELIAARVARARGRPPGHVGTPAGIEYTVDGAVATLLGPRDDAWLEAAIGDPHVAVGVTPWWADATDATYLLNRALVLMWTEVRWRQPAGDAERDLLDEIHRLLSRAFPHDPGLPYPWHAWAEIAGLRGIDDQMARQALARAVREPAPEPPIGYRRQAVLIRHEGWTLEIPGSFAERRTAEEWWGGESGRSITIAATTTGTPSGPMPAETFLAQVAGHLGSEALSHRDGEVVGRATLTTDASSGLEVGIVEGYSAIAGSGAAIRITFDDGADWQWALDTWRALAPG